MDDKPEVSTNRFVGFKENYTFAVHFRDVAQPGSALRSGRRGRWFESSHPDYARRSS